MKICKCCYHSFRTCFSLRGGVVGLCLIYIIWMVASLGVGLQPLLLQTYGNLLSLNLMSVAAAYNTFGLFMAVLAVTGLILMASSSTRNLELAWKRMTDIFHLSLMCCTINEMPQNLMFGLESGRRRFKNEKKFILPLLVFDSFFLVAYTFTFGYLIQKKSIFLIRDQYLVLYMGHIIFNYFAVILEYNLYRDLVRLTRVRPDGIPESLIILPVDCRPINPRAVLQQCRTHTDQASESDSYHYVYGVSESMVRFLRTVPQSSRPILYNADSESIFEAPTGSGTISAVRYDIERERSRSPPPPYKP